MNPHVEGVVLLYSGGLDSTTLLWRLLREEYVVEAIGFNYGQRHSRELEAATKIAASRNVPFRVIDLSSVNPLLKGSSQSDASVEVPEGPYDGENMKLTVVPNRNMIMLSIAAAYAISLKYRSLAYAAHSGDHAIYPDCRPDYISTMRQAFLLCDEHRLHFMTPYQDIDKGDIVIDGLQMGVPYSQVYSCYKGGVVHCGKCGSCRERQDAFKKAGVEDPIKYLG